MPPTPNFASHSPFGGPYLVLVAPPETIIAILNSTGDLCHKACLSRLKQAEAVAMRDWTCMPTVQMCLSARSINSSGLAPLPMSHSGSLHEAVHGATDTTRTDFPGWS